MRTVAAFATLCALVASACSDSDTGTISDGGSTTNTAPTTTTSSAPTTTTTAGTAPTTAAVVPDVSLPDVKIDDAQEAYRRIVAFVDDLSRNPQPDLLERYYDPECSTYPVILNSFTELVDNGWRYAVLEPTEITRLLSVFQDDRDAVLLSSYTIAADEVYDVDGNLVRQDPAQDFEKSISLTNSDEFGWRICEVDEVFSP